MNQVVNTTQNGAVMAAPAQHDDFMESIAVLARRANYVGELKRQIMVADKHYGVIPGCGDKPTLLKNGAELLCMAFKLASDANVEVQDLGNGHREYTVTTRLTSMSTGELVATGLGSCSTMETKYRYRGSEAEDTGKPVPKAYWDSGKDPATIGGRGFVAKKNEEGQWHIFKKGDKKLENPDIADTYNTVLKMASKRSLIDATLKATGGSCEFTQDIEDNPGLYGSRGAPIDDGYSAPVNEAPVRQAQRATTPPRNTPPRKAAPAQDPDAADRANFEGAMEGLRQMDPQKFESSLQLAGFNNVADVPANKRQEVFNLVNSAYQAK